MRTLLSLALVASVLPAAVQTPAELTTTNGLRFAAQWTSAGDDAPAALLFPMCWETPPETWAPVAAALKTRGVSSLVITYPGWRGNSPWPGPQPPAEPRDVYWDAQFRAVSDAAFAYVSARTKQPIVTAGSSCGVQRALDAALRNPDRIAGVVAFAGAHTSDQIAYVTARRVPILALTSRGDRPWPDQHQALVAASAHPASRLVIREETGHGTVLLGDRPDLAALIADWIAARLGR